MNTTTTTTLRQDRLARLGDITLGYGAHGKPPGDANVVLCATETVAWLAGEEHSDHPACLCPAIGAMLRTFNDRCGHGVAADERRKRVLGPLLPIVVGSRATLEVEQRRVWMGADWGLRVATPRLLRMTSMAPWADKLEALAEVTDHDSLNAARSLARQIRDTAWARYNEKIGALRKVAVAAVADDDDVPADAVAAVAAAADAAAAAAADVAVAADAVAAAAVADPESFSVIVAAAQKAKDQGGDYNAQYWAARKVAAEVVASRASVFASMRDELDIEFQGFIRRLVAVQS